jgi:hypothetical protein
MEEKVCSKCKIPQPIGNFNKHKRCKDGLNPECKSCIKIYNTARNQDPEAIRKRKERYDNRTKEQIELDKLKKRARKRKMTLDEIIKEDKIVSDAEKLNMKYCYTCLRTLDKSCFSKHKMSKDGLNTICKECRCESTRKYYKENVTDITEKKVVYRKNNWDYILNRQKIYIKNRNEKDPIFKLSGNLRRRLSSYIKYKGFSRKISESTQKMIGCSPQELRDYLESKFIDGMSWDNYGYDGWHLDHIIPLCTANTKEEVIKLNHYTNLQPLWAVDNMRKGGRIIKSPPILP